MKSYDYFHDATMQAMFYDNFFNSTLKSEKTKNVLVNIVLPITTRIKIHMNVDFKVKKLLKSIEVTNWAIKDKLQKFLEVIIQNMYKHDLPIQLFSI